MELRARGLLGSVQPNSNVAFPSVFCTHITVMFNCY